MLLLDLEVGVPLLFLELLVLTGLNAESTDGTDTVDAFRSNNGS